MSQKWHFYPAILQDAESFKNEPELNARAEPKNDYPLIFKND